MAAADSASARPMAVPVAVRAAARFGWTRRSASATDAELNTEVDAETDEQRDEGDRDEVEAACRQQADGCREDQADQRGGEDRYHDARRTHRQPQDSQERGEHRAEEQVRILGQASRIPRPPAAPGRSGARSRHAPDRGRANGQSRGWPRSRPTRAPARHSPAPAGPARCAASRAALRAPPATSVRHEKKAGWPATAFSNVAASAVIGGSMSWSVAWPRLIPSRMLEMAVRTPRRLGSAASGAKEGLRLHERPSWLPRLPPSTAATARCDRKTGRRRGVARCGKGRAFRAAPRRVVWPRRSASSGVAPSTTTMVRLLNCGNAASNASSCWRHSNFVEISSVGIGVHGEMLRRVEQRRPVSTTARSSTINGWRVLAATTRPISEGLMDTKRLKNGCGDNRRDGKACGARRNRQAVLLAVAAGMDKTTSVALNACQRKGE